MDFEGGFDFVKMNKGVWVPHWCYFWQYCPVALSECGVTGNFRFESRTSRTLLVRVVYPVVFSAVKLHSNGTRIPWGPHVILKHPLCFYKYMLFTNLETEITDISSQTRLRNENHTRVGIMRQDFHFKLACRCCAFSHCWLIWWPVSGLSFGPSSDSVICLSPLSDGLVSSDTGNIWLFSPLSHLCLHKSVKLFPRLEADVSATFGCISNQTWWFGKCRD